MTTKTYGEMIYEHKLQNHQLEDDVIEYRRLMEPNIIKAIYDDAHRVKNQPLYANQDFYMVLLFVIEPISGQHKPIILARKSCPTPIYQQAVWKFMHNSSTLEFLWSIPSAMLYWHIMKFGPKYLQDPETEQITKFVMLMESGELLQWVKKENGEKIDAVIKINEELACSTKQIQLT